jgi:hypothetical protein
MAINRLLLVIGLLSILKVGSAGLYGNFFNNDTVAIRTIRNAIEALKNDIRIINEQIDETSIARIREYSENNIYDNGYIENMRIMIFTSMSMLLICNTIIYLISNISHKYGTIMVV